jgi:predicted nucleic acid-binding protein
VKPVLVDTGVIVALLDRSERHHACCVTVIEGLERPLVTCEAVIAKSTYLLRGLPGASETVLQNVVRGVFQIPF